MSSVAQVWWFANGMVMVFGHDGNQLEKLQGKHSDLAVRHAIQKHCGPGTIFWQADMNTKQRSLIRAAHFYQGVMMPFNQFDQVAYIPTHANGDIDHPDVEYGFVAKDDPTQGNVFVRYWAKDAIGSRLRTLANSEATPRGNLVEHTSCSHAEVERAWKGVHVTAAAADAAATATPNNDITEEPPATEQPAAAPAPTPSTDERFVCPGCAEAYDQHIAQTCPACGQRVCPGCLENDHANGTRDCPQA